jgi:hypothetical protein
MEKIESSTSRIVKLILLRQGIYYLIHFFLIIILLPIILHGWNDLLDRIFYMLLYYLPPAIIIFAITFVIDYFRYHVINRIVKKLLTILYYLIFYNLTLVIPFLYIVSSLG